MANELPAWGEDRLREALVLLRDDDADPYSFSGDGDDAGRVITQHRYYRWGDDCVIAIGELNWPNQWDDDAFDAKVDALTAALDGTRGDAGEGAVHRVMEAMKAWTTGEQTITGQVWVMEGGKRVASFDSADDAYADARERNARYAIAALATSTGEGLTSGEGKRCTVCGQTPCPYAASPSQPTNASVREALVEALEAIDVFERCYREYGDSLPDGWDFRNVRAVSGAGDILRKRLATLSTPSVTQPSGGEG